MPFQIIRDDITHISADVIVNSANPHAAIGSGVDAAIHMAAGPRLIEARKKIGDIAEGDVRYSRAFDLLARYVFHTVGPDCRKEQENMEQKLRSCYTKSLQLAKKLYCESIAFPLISSGVYDCPKEQALEIAISAISEFLAENDMDVTLVVYDPESYVLSTQLVQDVKAYVDQHYVETVPKDSGINELDDADIRKLSHVPNLSRAEMSEKVVRWSLDESYRPDEEEEFVIACEGPEEEEDLPIERYRSESKEAPHRPDQRIAAGAPMPELKELLKSREPGAETFSQMLLRLIDLTGKRDAEIYLKAGQTRQLFSKIRNQRNYQPSKNTALSFAFALELNMDQTMDLLKSAGYTLSDGIRLDVALRFFIERGIYNLMEIKITLFAMEIEF